MKHIERFFLRLACALFGHHWCFSGIVYTSEGKSSFRGCGICNKREAIPEDRTVSPFSEESMAKRLEITAVSIPAPLLEAGEKLMSEMTDE